MQHIKHTLLLATIALLPVTAVSAKPHSATVTNAATVTSRYYDSLLSGDPQISGLTLFMHMLPKGGDLHNHYTGALYVETYLDWVDQQKYCIYSNTLRIETQPPVTQAAGNPCLSGAEIRANNDLYRALLMRWSDKDYYNHSHEVPPPDKQFFDTFGYFGATSGYTPHSGLLLLKARAKAENLQYLETMFQGAPVAKDSKIDPSITAAIDALSPDADAGSVTPVLARATAALDADSATQSLIGTYKDTLAGYASGLNDADFSIRFQTYVSRNNQASYTFAGLYAAFVAAHHNPLIVGVNIVGPENGIVAMRDYALHMQMIGFLHQRYPDVHLALHAGELTLGMVPPEGLRDHIRLAVEVAHAERIGHGIDIVYEADAPSLLQEMKAHDIPVEINLTSNEFILGVQGQAHPISVYRQFGVPFLISTDDEGVSRSDISNEYLLYATRYKPSYPELKATVYRSIRYAFLSADDKAAQNRILDQRFAQFEAAIDALSRQQHVAPR